MPTDPVLAVARFIKRIGPARCLLISGDRSAAGACGFLTKTLRFCWPSPALERLRDWFARLGLYEQLADVDGESLGKAVEDGDRRVLHSALDPAYIAPVDVRLERQAVLREIALHSKSSQIPSHKFPPLHSSRRAPCGISNHGLLSSHSNP
jgi:hypothetical protein